MSDEKMSYLFVCDDCGGMQCVVNDSQRTTRRYAFNMAEWINQGFKMLRVTNKHVRNSNWCECLYEPGLPLRRPTPKGVEL